MITKIFFAIVRSPYNNTVKTMSILDALKSFWGKLLSFWKDLPDETKKAIADAVAKSFEALLRSFYQANETKQKNSNQENQGESNA